jgi:hypothetical protein
MKTHGDPGWEKFPSYLDVVVPRCVDFFAQRDLRITVFVVGQDAALPKNHDALRQLAPAGHEIGNHSYHHEPWLHLYEDGRVEDELARAESHIGEVTGEQCVGFRGPGFSHSETVLRVLVNRGYIYDASTFPTFLGPLARTYYFMKARLDEQQKEERGQLFGKFQEGFRPLKPYHHEFAEGRLLEIPVTTMPIVKVPIHLSYVLYLSQFSRLAAIAYFRAALRMCRLSNTEPSILLHPLDFLGGSDNTGLDFFPAARMDLDKKLSLVSAAIELLGRHFRIVTMREHAEVFNARQSAEEPPATPRRIAPRERIET